MECVAQSFGLPGNELLTRKQRLEGLLGDCVSCYYDLGAQSSGWDESKQAFRKPGR